MEYNVYILHFVKLVLSDASMLMYSCAAADSFHTPLQWSTCMCKVLGLSCVGGLLSQVVMDGL